MPVSPTHLLTLDVLHGAAIATRIDDVARLRIAVFHEFPYLYDGDMEYEKRYMKTFAAARHSVLVLALDGARVSGASTGLPMAEEPEAIQAPFRERGYDPARVFYFSESVLEPAFRGQGIGVEFFRLREQWARQLGCFDLLAFCAVVRPADHPLCPPGHQPLDAFWERRGFSPTDMYCHMQWKDRDALEESTKSLRFWIKPLETR